MDDNIIEECLQNLMQMFDNGIKGVILLDLKQG